MDEGTGILPGLPPVAGKPVHLAFDGGQMTSDAGILLLATIEQRLGIAERLADCIEHRRAPERVRHTLAEMIRYRALLIAAGYLSGCAGGFPKVGSNTSTPAGTYTITVTGTSGADSHSTTVTLVVQ